jgi:hypothetical protein
LAISNNFFSLATSISVCYHGIKVIVVYRFGDS